MAAPERTEKIEKFEKVEKIDRSDRDERVDKERAKAVELAVGQIEKQFGKGSIMRLGGKDAIAPIPAISTGSISLDWALGVGGLPARPRHRDLRAGIVGQDDARAADDRAGAEARRRRGVHRRRTRARRAVRAEARRGPRQPARLAARQRRTGARDRRSADSLERRRRRRRRLGGRARAARGNRRRDGRSADGPAGAADVAGAAQAHGRRLEVEDVPDLHQSAAREDRRDVRQSGNDDRRPRAEVLLVGAHRHPPHRRDQGRRDRSSAAARA